MIITTFKLKCRELKPVWLTIFKIHDFVVTKG